MITGVITDLELAKIILDLTLAANTSFSDKLLTIPIPEENLPIRLTSKGNDEAVIFVIESASDKLS